MRVLAEPVASPAAGDVIIAAESIAEPLSHALTTTETDDPIGDLRGHRLRVGTLRRGTPRTSMRQMPSDSDASRVSISQWWRLSLRLGLIPHHGRGEASTRPERPVVAFLCSHSPGHEEVGIAEFAGCSPA